MRYLCRIYGFQPQPTVNQFGMGYNTAALLIIQRIQSSMKPFCIESVLIYNPTLKSSKKKPIQSDIQEAKIVGFIPAEAEIEEKCNVVGMAEGVYQFGRSLLTAEERQGIDSKLAIFLDNCCLVEKEVEENIWVFLKLAYSQKEPVYARLGEDEENIYIDNIITEEIAMNILEHFYSSFRTFYGPIAAYLFVNRRQALQTTIEYFTRKYQQVNRLEETKKLDACSYIVESIRALPLDINSKLKFEYFKNVMESYEPNLGDIMIFSHGLLAYSTLPNDITHFFAAYLYGVGQPFKFDFSVMPKKMRVVKEMQEIIGVEKYGTVFNSLGLGLSEAPNDSSLSSAPKKDANQDLLGIEEGERLNFPEVHICKDKEQCVYQLSYFFAKKMMFLTFYKNLNKRQQVIFQNRYYYDNIDKFSPQINDLMGGVLAQVDNYKFLYCNLSTKTGKSSIDKWSVLASEIRRIWPQLRYGSESMVTTTYQHHWVYGVNRLNRLLILLIPNQVPLQKQDDFAAKMFKQYFFKAYM